MNPMVQVQLNRLQHNVRALSERQQQLWAELEKEKETSENRLKVLWRHEQARATLDLNAREHADLQRRLGEAEAVNLKLAEHASRIAQWSAALADTLAE